MAKALFGHVGGGLPADLLFGRLRALEARVAELERALAVIEEELALGRRFETDNVRLRRLLTQAEQELEGRRATA